ncbi:hypothetical protein VIBNISOn1_p0005 [Vibrio nigripulchritudo SOn1]|uniref:Uncharacterized protein n=1 Tax=Vibrio nigripulchritudo SOn1 TaxID=1238450 RepID=A0AAV2VZG8_9VIBR|nr:hypothetical protein VIBNISOn1_p0005 [Vibrio nigripulchritudo SOn1]
MALFIDKLCFPMSTLRLSTYYDEAQRMSLITPIRLGKHLLKCVPAQQCRQPVRLVYF